MKYWSTIYGTWHFGPSIRQGLSVNNEFQEPFKKYAYSLIRKC